MKNDIAIEINNLSKQYRLGLVGTGTLSHDLKRWWTVNILGKEDPYLRIGETNLRNRKGESEYVWALKDVELEVKRGEVLGIIGKNGAGKSTLLKILSRVTKPTTGTLKYRGRMASLLEVGTGFHPEMTGRENIYMNGTIMGMSRLEINQKLDEIVAFAGVERYIDTPVKRYSSGMTVRLGFAIAAHLEPEILVVDEVLAVGDSEFQKKAIGKMQDVSKSEGRTVLFVSHNLIAIKELCDRLIVFTDGKISFRGNVFEGIDKYLDQTSNVRAHVTWALGKEPSIASAKLLEVSIKNKGKKISTYLLTELPIIIDIKFQVLKPSKIGTSIVLRNSHGQLIFGSISNHEKDWHMKIRPPGIYRNICVIPANLLTDGSYSVSVPFFEGFYESGIVEDELIKFNAHEKGFVRGDYPHAQKGHLIKPLLTWQSFRES